MLREVQSGWKQHTLEDVRTIDMVGFLVNSLPKSKLPKGPSTQQSYTCPESVLELPLPKSQIPKFRVLGPLGVAHIRFQSSLASSPNQVADLIAGTINPSPGHTRMLSDHHNKGGSILG